MEKRYAHQSYIESIAHTHRYRPIYMATEVDARIAALQAQHSEALAEKDRRIARLEEQELVIYDSFAVYSELATVDGTVSSDQLSIVLDAIARIWKLLP